MKCVYNDDVFVTLLRVGLTLLEFLINMSQKLVSIGQFGIRVKLK